MKLSNSIIPKLLNSKHQSKKSRHKAKKRKRKSAIKKSFRKKPITNLRQKSLKKRLKGGDIYGILFFLLRLSSNDAPKQLSKKQAPKKHLK